MLCKDYANHTSHYVSLYGKKTMVWMEVGSFFEMYATEENADVLHHVCGILNIMVTRKNKSLPCSDTNPLMAGFPTASLHKFMDVMIRDGYTVVLIEQTSPPPNPERKVTRIVSPSTYLDSTAHPSRYIMCLYVSYGMDQFKRRFPCLTVAYADLTTGETYTLDERACDETNLPHEWSRLLAVYNPKEMVIVAEETVPESVRVICRECIRHWHGCAHDRMDTPIASFHKIAYQTAVLKKVYKNTGLLNPIEFVGLERHPSCLVALTYLLQFVYEHDDALLSTLRPPMLIVPETWVTNTSLEQLNVIAKEGNESSIEQILNVCATPMGKRLFLNRLVHPISNPEVLASRYDRIEQLKTCHDHVRELLQPLCDMERLFRRLQLGHSKPSDMSTLFSSVIASLEVSHVAKSHGFEWCEWTASDHHALSDWCEELKRFPEHMNTITYLPGTVPALDEARQQVDATRGVIQDIVDQANKIIADAFKWDGTDITITKKRYESYLSSRKHHSPLFETHAMTNKTMWRLTYAALNDHLVLHESAEQQYQELLRTTFKSDVQRYAKYDWFVRWVACLSELDVVSTCALHAKRYRYVRPELTQETDSCIRATAVRHPMMERWGNSPYVPNDLELGGDQLHGMLLYGVNFSGKSSYMKAIGVNVVLAQAGMYVAADAWSFTPYEHVFTRLPSGDNVFKGQSTFIVEMNEVRSILKHSTNRSLVLGDEIACGTESVSGISIVAAGVVTLAKRRASFLFATHWHEVAELDVIRHLPNVRLKHMSVHYDSEKGVLVYDRLLKNGTGSNMYGLEVCASLDLPPEFMLVAHQVRHSYLDMSPHVLRDRSSRYNKNVFVDECTVCHKKAVEVHHIQEQALAEKGWIHGVHQNSPSNLMAVCASCHEAIHSKKMTIHGYQMTSEGVSLCLDKTEPTTDAKERVASLRRTGMSYASIAKEVGMSVYKVKSFF
jgi:DNA mismatch repair protein MutS